ncbi:uncharacterized protein EV422DRAFT_55421 [Fimicolochytrium jonesii]|uniref:uncharacterized protein n=1 Tax=Fimicolochytrium jonesii TaxID=1396493 RepID=UPI0022FE9394|nr:uncharacterized protein EV422DRAFT_55421 [Fimicolochytrium jonesii]KAI8821140.1 hypothetical protein EV422DRAFT_55421 [Fimicolochytrium jonesii]
MAYRRPALPAEPPPSSSPPPPPPLPALSSHPAPAETAYKVHTVVEAACLVIPYAWAFGRLRVLGKIGWGGDMGVAVVVLAATLMLQFASLHSTNSTIQIRTGYYRPNAEPGIVAGLLLPPLVTASMMLAVTDPEMSDYFALFLKLSLWFSSLEGARLFMRLGSGWTRHVWATVLVGVCLTSLTSRMQIIYGLGGVVIFKAFLHMLQSWLRPSFTLGEALVVAQTLALLFIDAVFSLQSKLLPQHPQPTLMHRSEMNVFMHALVYGMLLIGIALSPLLRAISQARLDGQTQRWMVLSGFFYVAVVALVLFIIAPWTQLCLGAEPFMWTINFVLFSGFTRPVVTLYWASIIVIGVTIAWLKFPETTANSAVLNWKRKYFHLLATLMFIPGYIWDPEFMHLAFSVALAVLILFEYLRHFRLYPLGQPVHDFLSKFLDDRDCGPVILSHLYLLVGCALPVWLNRIPMRMVVGGLSGMLTLGIGDTMASIHGKRFGRNKWPGTAKTVEGTLAFIVTITVACVTISLLTKIPLIPTHKWPEFLVCIIFSSLLEAFSDQNDNLIIPLYTFAFLHLTLL